MSDSVRRNDRAPFVGLGLLIVGIIFLLRNFELIHIGHRWWTLFFLIPISYLVIDILRRRQTAQGTSATQASGSWIALITLVVTMVIFLLGMDWGIIWPVFIVIGGLSLMLSGWR